ncbi:MAG: S1 family peptidase [Deltaproteobacteria bacterium]|nr:S1 family peptidase [Deltaproteobacteria bacterium]
MLTWSLSALAAIPWMVGGSPTVPGSWQGVVGVVLTEEVRCTGVVVAPRVVLTAAHCAVGLEGVLLDTDDYALGGRFVAAERVITPPWWAQTYDVAVVRLAEDAGVPAWPLALDCVADTALVDGAQAVGVGFGRTDLWGRDANSRLHEAWMTVTDADCSSLAAGCAEAVSPGGELIAGGGGVDGCAGDSGGPLFAVGEGGQLWLAGLSSRGAAPADTPCGDGGIYTRADAISAWVEQVAEVSLPRPTCGPPNHPPAPAPVSLVLRQGERVEVWLDPRDPDDPDDGHRFSIVQPPSGVEARVDAEGTLALTARRPFLGRDALVVEVCDDGYPPRCADAPVDVTVIGAEIFGAPAPAPGGCSHLGGGAAGLLAALALLATGARRR